MQMEIEEERQQGDISLVDFDYHSIKNAVVCEVGRLDKDGSSFDPEAV